MQWNNEPCRVGPQEMDGSWWRFLKKYGPLDKEMANHFSILALITPWTVCKGKQIGHWKRNSSGWYVPNMLQFKSIHSLALSFLYSPNLTSIHDYWKTIALTRQTFVGKVMSLLFNMLSRLVIAFLPRSKCLLISCLQSLSAVILEPKKIKSHTVSIVSPSICHEVMGPDAMILVCWMLSFKPSFSLSCFTFINSLFSSLAFLP